MSRMASAIPLEDILEADWSKQLVGLAKTLGWTRVYHTFSSKRSTMGFPDLVCLRERCVFIELKREKTKLTDEQKGWLLALLDAGQEAYVARPRDLDDLAKILAGRITGMATGWLRNAERLRQATADEVQKGG